MSEATALVIKGKAKNQGNHGGRIPLRASQLRFEAIVEGTVVGLRGMRLKGHKTKSLKDHVSRVIQTS